MVGACSDVPGWVAHLLPLTRLVLSYPAAAAVAAREGEVGGGAGGSLASADLPLLLGWS